MRKFVIALMPLIPVAALNLWATANRERFPDPMATHWNIFGKPDAFASLSSHLLMMNIILGVIAILWLLVSMMAAPRAVRRLGQLIVGVVFAVLAAILFQVLRGQLDLQDATQAEFGYELMLWLVPVLLLIPIVIARPQVAVDESVKVSLRGIPFLNLGFDEIKSAQVGSVRARDFGGWGLRYAKKTTAFVPSSGEALELGLEGGSRVLVRTDRAAELAREIEQKRRSK